MIWCIALLCGSSFMYPWPGSKQKISLWDFIHDIDINYLDIWFYGHSISGNGRYKASTMMSYFMKLKPSFILLSWMIGKLKTMDIRNNLVGRMLKPEAEMRKLLQYIAKHNYIMMHIKKQRTKFVQFAIFTPVNHRNLVHNNSIMVNWSSITH